MDYKGSINLEKFNIERASKGGVEGIFIPFKDNKAITLSERGIYLNLFIKESPQSRYGESHYIVASLPKTELETMSQDERRKHTPILGNMKPISGTGQAQRNTNGNWDSPSAGFNNSGFDDDLPM